MLPRGDLSVLTKSILSCNFLQDMGRRESIYTLKAYICNLEYGGEFGRNVRFCLLSCASRKVYIARRALW
jgi:hypothetical protein